MTQAATLPLTTVVVQFKKHVFKAYPCQQLGHSSRMQTGTGPRGAPMGARMCPYRARAWGGAGKRGDGVISLTLV